MKKHEIFSTVMLLIIQILALLLLIISIDLVIPHKWVLVESGALTSQSDGRIVSGAPIYSYVKKDKLTEKFNSSKQCADKAVNSELFSISSDWAKAHGNDAVFNVLSSDSKSFCYTISGSGTDEIWTVFVSVDGSESVSVCKNGGAAQ